MRLRSKLILAVLLEIGLTITIVGLWAYQGSKTEIERLARDLLRARTEYAYAICDRYNQRYGQPTEELAQEISKIRIATDGYTVAIDNSPESKGILLIHPTDVGTNVNTDKFPHIQEVIRNIDVAGEPDEFSAYTEYHQETEARGRQGELKIAYYMYYKPWNWILLSSAYERDIFESADVVRHRTVQAIAVVAILAIIVMTLSVRKILAPLRQLNQTTQEVAQGKLDATFTIDSTDEVGDLARSFNSMLRSLKHNMRITHEFEIARRMQREMLPAAPPDFPGFTIQARSLPAREVGGDFYDFIRLSNNQLALIIGDVSGQGVSGAIVMSAAISAIRYAAEERRTPRDILAMANRRLAMDLQENMFVAVFCGIIDLEKNRITYSNAGQTLPIICRNNTAFYLPAPDDGDQFPIGIRHPVRYGQHQIALQPGDLIVLYTDGVVDMMNGSGEPYSFDRFQHSVQRHAHKPLAEVIDRLVQDAEEFVGSSIHHDDVTLLAARIEALQPATSRADLVVDAGELASPVDDAREIRLSIPSCCGYEKTAMDLAAKLGEMLGFRPDRIEDLRTAVSEACLNAIEHGNQMEVNSRVDVLFKLGRDDLTIQIIDNGTGFQPEGFRSPDLAKKISGQESPRGLGLFLIEKLVDQVEFKTMPELGHVTTLRMEKH